jgi:hypothetical protein
MTLRGALCDMFQRVHGQEWPSMENTLLATVAARPKCLSEVDALFDLRDADPEYFPKSVKSLLEKWDQTLDRARSEKANKPKYRGDLAT